MKLYEICFSPTGGTKKAADMLANGLTGEIQRSSQRQDERAVLLVCPFAVRYAIRHKATPFPV